MILPAEQGSNLRHRLFFHLRAGAPAIQGVVVGVDPQREHISSARHRVRRFEHLPGVQRVEVGIIILHALGGFQQHGFHAFGVDQRRFVRRQVGEAAFQFFEGTGENGEGVFFEGHGIREQVVREQAVKGWVQEIIT